MSELAPLIERCEMIVGDRELTEVEARQLANWLSLNPQFRQKWPGSVLSDRLTEILADGKITEPELVQLGMVLDQISELDPAGGGGFLNTVHLPFSEPAPTVGFESRRFAFLGEFVFGSSEACGTAVRKLGGISMDVISGELDYVVLGAVMPQAFLEGDERVALEQAVAVRAQHPRLSIISEQRWADAFEHASGSSAVRVRRSDQAPRLPIMERRLRRQNDFGGGHHDIDLSVTSCTCADWQGKRKILPPQHLGRCCPHVAHVLHDLNAATAGAAWLGSLLQSLTLHQKGLNPTDRFTEVWLDDQPVLLIANQTQWLTVIGPTPAGPYEKYSFDRKENRWAFRLKPRHGDALAQWLTTDLEWR